MDEPRTCHTFMLCCINSIFVSATLLGVETLQYPSFISRDLFFRQDL